MPQQLPGSLGIHLQSPNSALFEHKLFPAQTNVRHTAAFVAIMVERNTIRRAKIISKKPRSVFPKFAINLRNPD